MYDVLFKNAKILDGTGSPWSRGDVAVQDGFIARIGRLDNDTGKIVDASGKCLAPGFIDAHSHSDLPLVVNPTADSKVMQGVTTEIIGQCGSSGAPRNMGLRKQEDDTAREAVSQLQRPTEVPDWTDTASYLNVLESQGVSVNVAALVGHGTVRRQVMGVERRAPTDEELSIMKRLVAEAMEQGAFGFSSGLIYVPGTYSETEEVIELAKVAARRGGIYFTHMRNEGPRLMEALEEAIRIGAGADMPVQISHFKVMGQPNWGRVNDAITRIEKARADGLDITADQYPYIASSTGLGSTVPAAAWAGGRDLDGLKDPTRRKEFLRALSARGNWDKIVIVSVADPADEQFVGKSVEDVGTAQCVSPEEACLGLLERNRGNVPIVNFAMSEDDVRTVMQVPWVMAGSDGRAYNAETAKGKPHPRSYGTFVRLLGHYARDLKALRLEEAVRKMTSLPAARLGLQDRGIIKEGMRADLVLFDADTVIDRATFSDPHQYASGIEYVLVNGQIVVEKGHHTGERPGMALRHA